MKKLFDNCDWWIITIYLILVFFGWMNIYASVHTADGLSIFDFSLRSGKQFVWILSALCIAAIIVHAIPAGVYEPAALILYAISTFLLILVIFAGSEVKGSHSWFTLGSISFQPAELSKMATSLMLASVMGRHEFRLRGRNLFIVLGIILLPMLTIILEKETGSALVYAGFTFVLYREGLPGWILATAGLSILLFVLTLSISPFIGLLVLSATVSLFDCIMDGTLKWWLASAPILLAADCFVPSGNDIIVILVELALYAGFSIWKTLRGIRQKFRIATLSMLAGGLLLVLGTQFIFTNVLKDYQRARIEILLGMREDNSGVGYNVNQSLIAIGSGGLLGKGFCRGTQTAYGFVPEQSTDFIFCTVGEEWGFIGCVGVLLLYVALIWRIVRDSENSRKPFTRIYGYCLASCLFMHLFINVGMTLNLMPVIGIPLPFMSYGGSSLWAFTIMLFIFVVLEREERKYF